MAEDILQWLERLGLGQYAKAFAENAVEPDLLGELTDDDLKELGVSALGHRRRILAAIRGSETGVASASVQPADKGTAARVDSSEAERRQLTVLFCDLVGSTELSAKLDPEDMRDVLRTYQDACSDVVTRYEGYVAKFMGDGVYAYFGYPMAHEDDAERAINTGLGIIETIKDLGTHKKHGADLAVRIGIATGDVAVGDLIGEGASEEANVVGEAPNLAARLQTIAEPDTVVIGAATRALATGLFETRSLGAQNMKGFTHPVESWCVLGTQQSESRFQATRGGYLTDLVGRDEELEILLRRWDRAKAGEGQVVLISGEPGIGKSRLAQALQDEISGEPHFRLRYQCSPHFMNSALHPLIEQLERGAGFVKNDSPVEKLDKLETALAQSGRPTSEKLPLFASLLSIPTADRNPPLNLTAQQQKALTLNAFIDQLTGLAEQQPVFFVFEDAHWIDPTTQELLEMTVEQVPDCSVLMLITHRPDFDTPWVGRPRVTPMILNRLETRDCAVMVENIARDFGIADDLRDRIATQTDGVPLFIEELTKSVLESTTDLPTAIDVPTTLKDSLEARLDRLGAAKEVAQIGAVIGRAFDYRLLSSVADLEEKSLDIALKGLIDAGLATVRGSQPDATYTFKHALVQDTAYQSLLRTRRAELHGRIANFLDDSDPGAASSEPEIIAYHYTEAGLAEPAIEHWLAAGRKAIQRAAINESVRHYNRGLEILLDLPESTERHKKELTFQTELGSGTAALIGWFSEEAEKHYSRARELCSILGDQRALFPVLWGFWMSYGARRQRTAWRATANELLRTAQNLDDPDLLLEAHHACWGSPFHGEFQSQIEHAKQGLAIYNPEKHRELAPLYGGHDAGVCGHCHLGLALWVTGYPDQGRNALSNAVKLAHEISHPPSLSQALNINGFLHAFDGDWPEVIRINDDGISRLGELTTRVTMGHMWGPRMFVLRGWARAALGDVHEGLSDIRQGDEMNKIAGYLGGATTLAFQAEALNAAGLQTQALDTVTEVLPILKSEGEQLWEANAHTLNGLLLLECFDDRQSDAESCFQEALDIARSQSAKMWELRAATQLARLWYSQGKSNDAHDSLAPVYDWFTEGFDTADLKIAKELLDALS